MSEKPIMHGRDGRPGGMDSGHPSAWLYPTSTAETAWDSGTAYSQGDLASDGEFNWVALQASTGIEPGSGSRWPSYWAVTAPLFQNSWDNSGGTKMPMRFRIVVGLANRLDPVTGEITAYHNHQIEIQGSVAGGSDGDTIFTLPNGYIPEYDLHLSACDDSGDFVVFTIQQSGDVVAGFV